MTVTQEYLLRQVLKNQYTFMHATLSAAQAHPDMLKRMSETEALLKTLEVDTVRRVADG